MSEILRMQEQIEEYLLTLPINTLITMGSLKKCQPESSYIPLDYYFNSYCEDSQWNKQKLFF